IQEEKAIVTNVPGTTRDVIEEYVNIRGVPLKLIDTAGIRETEDIVEKIGVERSRKVLKEADLILYMLNNNESLSEEDLTILEMIKQLNFIMIINKSDLENKLNINDMPEWAQSKPIVKVSLIEEKGIDEIEETLVNLF